MGILTVPAQNTKPISRSQDRTPRIATGFTGGERTDSRAQASLLKGPMDTTDTDAAAEIVRNDLEYITNNLSAEFARMAGRRLLIVGGAGFLGYYLVQSILHW